MELTKCICAKYLTWLLMLGGLAIPAVAGVGAWTDISGVRGNVSAMAEDSAGVLYAVIGNGVYRQAASGSNWVEVNGGLAGAKVRRLQGGANGVVYAGTDIGVFRLAGGANTWVAMNAGLTSTDITALALADNGGLYAATAGGGVFKNSDGSGIWTTANKGVTNNNVTALAVLSGGRLYAGTNSGVVFKSTDGGAAWVATTSVGYSVNALAVSASGELYAGVNRIGNPILHYGWGPIIYAPDGNGLFKSADGGNTWSELSAAPAIDYLAIDASGILYRRGYSKDSAFCYVGAEGSVTTSTNSVVDCTTLLVGAKGTVYAGTDKGVIFKGGVGQEAGIQIRTPLDPLNLTNYLAPLAVNGAGTLYVGTYGQGVFKSSNRGQDWTTVNSGLSGLSSSAIYALTADTNGVLYAGTNAGVFKSTNNGGAWEVVPGLEDLQIRVLLAGAGGALYAANVGRGLYKHVEGGAWVALQNGLGNGVIGDILAMAMDASGTLYVGTESGGVFKSSNAGSTWTPLKNSLISPSVISPVCALAVSAQGVLYAGTRSGVFKTSNGGATWALVNDGLNNEFVTALVADAYGTIYARTDTGAYQLADGSSTWVAVSSGLPAHNTNGVVNTGTLVLDKSGQLYTANVGGIYQYTPLALAGLKPRLVNLSGRANTLTAEGVAIAGFTISGGNKTVLLTAKGPSLFTAGVPNPLANPKLRVMDSKGGLVASNDNWGDNLNIAAITATQGAPTDASESALLLTLPSGAYTAIMEGANAGTGNGLVAVDGVANPGDSGSLTNLSTRAMVGTGDNVLIAGLTIVDGPRKILLTAKGPSMTALGVTGALADPTIALHDATGALIAVNDDQAGAANYAEIVATGKAPSDPRESAILLTLQPGIYTLIVRGSGGTQGIALVAVDQVD